MEGTGGQMAGNDKFPYFPFYPRDFTSDSVVEAMTTEEVGAYTLLLCKAWHERPVGSLPDDQFLLARWSRLSAEDWARIRLMVLRPFALGEDGRYHQKRMQEEHQKLMSMRRRRVSAGKKGGYATKRSRSNATGNATAMPQQMDGEAEARAYDSDSGSDSGSQGVCKGGVRKPRAPDPIWDTVAELFYPSGVPPGLSKKLGAVVRDLKALGATPDGIRTRHTNAVAAEWDAFGPEAIVNAWDRLASVGRSRGSQARNLARIEAPAGKYAGRSRAPSVAGPQHTGNPAASPESSGRSGGGCANGAAARNEPDRNAEPVPPA